jgi:hypothetical protein
MMTIPVWNREMPTVETIDCTAAAVRCLVRPRNVYSGYQTMPVVEISTKFLIQVSME